MALGDEHSARTPRRRILVIANETVTGTVLHEAVRFRAHNASGEVLVVAPALNSHSCRGASSGDDDARRSAEKRLERSLERLRVAGVDARGQIGEGDPLRAIADALSVFAADEIIIATHPARRSRWLAHDLVGRARRRFAQPILHIVVDLERRAEDLAARAHLPTSMSSPTPTAS